MTLQPFFQLTSPRTYFYLSNGQIIKSLSELPEALAYLDDSVFRIHVTTAKNDFAKWIYDVFGLSDLASRVGMEKSKEGIIRLLKAYIAGRPASGIQNSDAASFAFKDNFRQSAGIYSNNGKAAVSLQAQEAVAIQKPASAPQPQQNASPPAQQTAQPAQSPQPAQQSQRAAPTLSQKMYIWKQKPVSASNNGQQIKSNLSLAPASPVSADSLKAAALVVPVIKKEEPALQPVPKPVLAPAVAEAKPSPPQVQPAVAKPAEPPKMPPPVIMAKAEPQVRSLIQPQADLQDVKNPDEYFERNPVTIGQFVEARKKTISLQPLDHVDYHTTESAKVISDRFKDTYSQVYQRLSQLRKNGFDTSLAELMITRIPARIKIYDTTGEEKDAVVIRRFLNETIEELNNVL